MLPPIGMQVLKVSNMLNMSILLKVSIFCWLSIRFLRQGPLPTFDAYLLGFDSQRCLRAPDCRIGYAGVSTVLKDLARPHRPVFEAGLKKLLGFV